MARFSGIGSVGPAGPAAQEVDYQLQGGCISGDQPIFDGDPLFSGSYIRNGDMVFVDVRVDFDNILDFGDEQYFVTLPFSSKYDATLRSGHIDRDSNGRKYGISGHLSEGSNIMTLWYTAGTGQDEEFDHNSPYLLQVEDRFHIAGTYIAEPLA
jgi:hypothetical protein